MTVLLQKAFDAASKLPEIQQNVFARWVLEEIEADRKWDTSFAESEDVLEILAEEALGEYKAGKATEIDANRL